MNAGSGTYCAMLVCSYSIQDLTGGAFEEILASLKLTEGVDYVNFS